MLLETNDGVGCDLCSLEMKDKFTYYSFVFKKIEVKNGFTTIGNSVDWDIEICSICYNNMLDRCRKHIGNIKSGFIKCDLCPAYNNGNFEYFVTRLDKVTVNRDTNPSTSVEGNVMDFNVCVPCRNQLKSMKSQIEQPKPKGNWTVGA